MVRALVLILAVAAFAEGQSTTPAPLDCIAADFSVIIQY